LNDGPNSAFRVLVCLCSSLFYRSDFVLTRLDIGRDGVFNVHDVGSGASAPLAGIPKLLPVFL
jgi:hypothetical protein